MRHRRGRPGAPALVLVLVLAMAIASGCGGDGGSSSAASFFDGPVPRVIAHRGGADRAPESTLVGFEHGLALGATILETDAHTTRDGVVVLVHDATVDRTTEGSGRVHDLSLAELAALDAGYRFTTDGGTTFPYRGTGVTVPTLDEAFERFPRERFLIEIKQGQPPMEAELLAVIDRHRMRDRVCVASFIDDAIERFRALAPEVCTGTALGEVLELVLRPLEELAQRGMEAQTTQLPRELLDVPAVGARVLEKAHALGLEVHAWTVDDPADMGVLLDLGVDGIITDRPDTLSDVVASFRGRPEGAVSAASGP